MSLQLPDFFLLAEIIALRSGFGFLLVQHLCLYSLEWGHRQLRSPFDLPSRNSSWQRVRRAKKKSLDPARNTFPEGSGLCLSELLHHRLNGSSEKSRERVWGILEKRFYLFP